MKLGYQRADVSTRCGWLARTGFSLLFFTTLLSSAGGADALPSSANGATSELAEPSDSFATETFTTEHGLPQTSVTAVLQTRSGYLWAATYDGIAQFDGLRFTVFDSGNTKGLSNSRVTALFEDSQGNIWIGHDKGALTKYWQGRFEPHPIHRDWSTSPIQVLREDAAGDIWAVNVRGEALRLRDEVVVEPPAEMATEPWVWPDVTMDLSGKLLMVRNGGVAELTAAGARKITFGATTNARPYYNRIAAARDGGLWVLSDGRLRKWNGKEWTTDLGPALWGNAFVAVLRESSSGNVFVGTMEEGLFIYSPKKGWMHLTRHNGLPQDWVRCLAEDRQQNIWVGTSGGLVVLRPRKVLVKGPPDGWQGRPVLAITMASDGAFWAATEGAGIYRLKDNAWSHFDGSAGLSNLFVWAVAEDGAHRIWAGTWGGGLFRFENGRFTRQFDLAERGEPATALRCARDGTLWIGTTAGLIKCRGDKLERLNALGDAAAGDVRAIEEAPDGSVWFATQGSGLGHLDQRGLKSYSLAEGLPREFMLSLYAETSDTLWIGTLDRGICRFRGGKFDLISTAQGLPNNTICHIEDDGLGNLWVNSQKGLFRVGKRDLNDCADGKSATVRAVVFGKADGMPTLAGTGGFTPSGFRAGDGQLWFPTARGVVTVNPPEVRRDTQPPAVWIEEVQVDGKTIELPARPRKWAGVVDPDTVAKRQIDLQPGRRQLDIVFTGISFTDASEVRFRYRMEGLDAQWTDGGTRRRVTYSFLPAGHYQFRVKACNSDDIWNEAGDAIEVVVLPQFWQTWWFRISVAVAAVVVLGGGVYLESRRRHRRKLERVARERELERERTRIAQDIHDDLGASLTRIGMLSQSAAGELEESSRATTDLNQIYSTARDLTRAMDEIVWAVNPRHDTLDSLTNYIARFAHDFLSAAHIRCRLDTPINVPEMTVRSEVRHNLMLALKETLNNVVKHSGATEVRIAVELQADGLLLEIADNGHGFEFRNHNGKAAENRVASGNGIPGMRNRMSQIGGEVRIQSTGGQGTKVCLLVGTSALSHPVQGL